jgi:acyl-CoA dehydrogenase
MPADLEAFRADTRGWLEENCPLSMRTNMPENEVIWGGRGQEWVNPDAKVWKECMAARGWTVPRWPKEYGGDGLSLDENKVLLQEMDRITFWSTAQKSGLPMRIGRIGSSVWSEQTHWRLNKKESASCCSI